MHYNEQPILNKCASKKRIPGIIIPGILFIVLLLVRSFHISEKPLLRFRDSPRSLFYSFHSNRSRNSSSNSYRVFPVVTAVAVTSTGGVVITLDQ